jgi:hypothetical protein
MDAFSLLRLETDCPVRHSVEKKFEFRLTDPVTHDALMLRNVLAPLYRSEPTLKPKQHVAFWVRPLIETI